MIPGEILTAPGDIEINADRASILLSVANTGDRPIQVGSHYHFFETNPAPSLDRAKARGHRLAIPAGTAVRFEPGQTREVGGLGWDLPAPACRHRAKDFLAGRRPGSPCPLY